MFNLGQTEDHSLGNSFSDSSEELLQRGGWQEVSVYVILVKGDMYKQAHILVDGYC